MKHIDDTFYIELFLNVIIKVENEEKKQKLRKLQKMLENILKDEDLDIVKSESNIVMMSETELLNNLQFGTDNEFN